MSTPVSPGSNGLMHRRKKKDKGSVHGSMETPWPSMEKRKSTYMSAPSLLFPPDLRPLRLCGSVSGHRRGSSSVCSSLRFLSLARHAGSPPRASSLPALGSRAPGDEGATCKVPRWKLPSSLFFFWLGKKKRRKQQWVARRASPVCRYLRLFIR